MAWPTVAVSTLNMDADTDTGFRADILDLVTKFNAAIAMLGVANGVCDLDAGGKVPASRGVARLDTANTFAAAQSVPAGATGAQVPQAQEVALAGGGNASGSWNISITGSSASCTGNAASATSFVVPAGNQVDTIISTVGVAGTDSATVGNSYATSGTTIVLDTGSVGVGFTPTGMWACLSYKTSGTAAVFTFQRRS